MVELKSYKSWKPKEDELILEINMPEVFNGGGYFTIPICGKNFLVKKWSFGQKNTVIVLGRWIEK